jgi:signal transduction histidine kinase
VAFVLSSAMTSGLLAVGSFVLVQTYRHRSFVDHARRDASLILVSAPDALSLADLQDLLLQYQTTAGFETLVAYDSVVLSSARHLTADDIPAGLRDALGDGKPHDVEANVDGAPYLVVAGQPLRGSQQMYFFFPRRDLIAGVREVRDILVVAWVAVVLLAVASGRWIARRTLRPVRSAAALSQRLAAGELDARLPEGSGDEVGVLARSLNEMADALQHQMQELREAAARERRFTSDVAHDLRTPLTTLVSAAALLEDELAELPPSARRPIELLVRDVHRLHTLVTDLLELARLEGGHEAVNAEVLDLRTALQVAVGPAGAGISVTVDGDDLQVVADRRRLRSMVGNLVQNALVHGSPPVEVRAHQADDGCVEIDVLDRGRGLPADEVDSVFDRFHKVDTARGGPGSGLGLAIARRHAELQGGTILAANRTGGGARFTIRLPAP